ncbi:MAG TPA: hypothetical protein PK020_16935 [Ilumatobacteraceae bacterium]|nr:hypothetical protein [Ilumatobacteraceae bacterium]
MPQGTASRICITGADLQHGYCGRQNNTTTDTPSKSNCKDCGAAQRADIQAGRPMPQPERISQ